jgi:YD repeat-containing protein
MHTLLSVSLLLIGQGTAEMNLPPGATARLGSVHFRHAIGGGAYVALSPDGKLLATGAGNDGTRIWDVATGKLIWFRPLAITSNGGPVTFSPDGQLLALRGSKSLLLWDIKTYKARFELADSSSIHSPVFSADSKRIAAQGADGKMRVWETGTGKIVAEWQAPWLASTFSSDGKTVITDGQKGLLRFWNVASQKVTRHVQLADHYYLITKLVVSPDNKVLAIGTGPHHENDGATPATYFRMHDFATGKERYRIAMNGHFVSAVAFAPDGKTMVLAKHGTPSELEMREVTDGKLLRTIPLPVGNYYDLSFSGDGKMLAAASGELQTIQLWKYPDFTPHLPTVGHTRPITAVAYSKDGQHVHSSSEDGTLITWDLKTSRPRHSSPLPIRYINAPSIAHDLFPLPDTKLIAAAVWHTNEFDPRQGTLYLYQLSDSKEVQKIAPISGGVAMAPDGKILAAGAGARIRLWDPITGKIRTTLEGQTTGVRRLAFAPDGHLLASIHNDGTVALWYAQAGRLIRKLKATSEDSRPISSMSRAPALTFSPDGRYIIVVTSRWSTMIEAWEIASGQQIQLIRRKEKQAEAPALMCIGRTLLFSDHWNAPQLYDLATGEVLEEPIGPIRLNGIARSPDGRSLATAGNDGFVLTWKAELLNGPAIQKADLADKDLIRLWADLNGTARTAFAAHWEIARGGEAAAKFLGGKLRPVPTPDPMAVAKRIAELDSNDFKIRERASRDLEEWGPAVELQLRKALSENPPIEGNRRLQALLARAESLLAGPEELRIRRAIAVLESINTASARAALQNLADGAPGSRISLDAKQSLQRLGP